MGACDLEVHTAQACSLAGLASLQSILYDMGWWIKGDTSTRLLNNTEGMEHSTDYY